MKTSKFFTLAKVSCILFLVFFSGMLFSKGLNSNELKILINDKTVESESARGFAAITYFSPDGTYRKSKRDELIKGVWNINNDGKLCKKRDDKSTQSCRTIVKSSNVWKAYKIPGNPAKSWKHKSTWLKISNGNPNNL